MKKSVSICIRIIIAVVSCNVYKDVQIFRDRSIDFEKYETYAWLPEKESNRQSEYNSDFIRQKTRNYFGHCMAQRKLKPDTINPQLLLQIEWLSHARTVEVPVTPGLPEYYDADYYNAPTIYLYNGKISGKSDGYIDYQDKEIVTYAHGGAKLTAIDRKTSDIVWEGVAQGDLYDPNVMYDDLHPAIHKLMKKFPIKIPKK